MKIAIIVVDMINDFVTGVLACKNAEKIIPKIKRLLHFAHERGIPVIYTNDSHLPNLDEEFEVWPAHAILGTKGAEVVEELKPRKDDFVIRKRRYSGFFGTDLDVLLRELHIDTVVLVGLVTDICIQHTAADAFFRGYQVIVPKNGVETLSEKAQKTSIEYMKKNYGAKITTIEKLLKELA